MADKKQTINKQKGIEIIADLLFSGKKRKDIIQELTKTYNIADATIDKYMKLARPVVRERQEAAELAAAEERAMAAKDGAKRLNISKEAVLEGYAKIAMFDIRTIFNEDGTIKSITEMDEISAGAIAGIEVVEDKDKEGKVICRTHKIRIADKRAALDSIAKVQGYNAPVKVADTDKDGNDKPKVRQVIKINGQEISFE